MAEPIVHHRGPDFRVVYERCLARLQEVFRTRADVLLFTSSGTGTMESAVANLCSPGERVCVVSAGAFGERWASIAEAYGCEVDRLAYEWGESPSADDLASRLAERESRVVLLTHSETSTGVVADVRSLAASAQETGALSVVDGSQKALMTPPGLAMVSVSQAAWDARGTLPRFYFDWERTRKAQAVFDAAFTPAVSLVAGLDVALGILLEQGLDAAFERHVRLGRACREGIKAMGLELFSPDDDGAAVVTAVHAPDGVDAGELLLRLRDRHGVTLAPGQGPLKGKIFRIGHIGWFDVFDIATAFAAVELTLVELGADVERGAAVTRAFEAYEQPVHA